jgi:external thioesterase TEII
MNKDAIMFIIPFAGGNAYSMRGLQEKVGHFMEVETLEFPGRGKRIKEPLLTDAWAITNDIYQKIATKLDNYKEYYVFGHSMGTLIGVMLIKQIVENGGREPKHLFVSGRGGPNSEKGRRNTYTLPSAEFRKKLKKLGGSPSEVLENEMLMDLIEPIIRADFQAIETFDYDKEEPIKLNVPITGFYGSDEETNLEDMGKWKDITNSKVDIIELEGNHFFIFNHWNKLSSIIKDKLSFNNASVF